MTIIVEGLVRTTDITKDFNRLVKDQKRGTLFNVQSDNANYLLMKVGSNNLLDIISGEMYRLKNTCTPLKPRLFNIRNVKTVLKIHSYKLQKAVLTLED
jgi:hypothetical protein